MYAQAVDQCRSSFLSGYWNRVLSHRHTSFFAGQPCTQSAVPWHRRSGMTGLHMLCSVNVGDLKGLQDSTVNEVFMGLGLHSKKTPHMYKVNLASNGPTSDCLVFDTFTSIFLEYTCFLTVL